MRSQALRSVPVLSRLGREHHARVIGRRVAAESSHELPLPPIAPGRSEVILQCRGATLAFGGLIAVNAVDLVVRQGEIIGLVGPNGSGKTSLFNLISGIYAPKEGTIILDGRPLTGLRRDQVARLGIGRTYQIPRPFGDLTVRENIAAALMFREDGDGVDKAMLESEPFAAYVGLSRRLDERADSLGLQEKKALELSRALACRPRLLLVDEVASGLSTAEVRQFVRHIREMRDRYGITVIWVEHIFSALEQTVDRLVVMEEGRIIADGPLRETMNDPRVLASYLGSAKGKSHEPVGG
ncbi:MAG: ABC transporter ATP-binding protein [Hyphomicrobiales bacterium]|nr:ABC transporter ATP-binding protein [Hyphomicrobiales bacterium]